MALLNNVFLKLLFLNSISLIQFIHFAPISKTLGRVRVLRPNMQVYKIIYLFLQNSDIKVDKLYKLL